MNDGTSSVTWHSEFARCSECGHATVGPGSQYAIHHRDSCSMADREFAASSDEAVEAAALIVAAHSGYWRSTPHYRQVAVQVLAAANVIDFPKIRAETLREVEAFVRYGAGRIRTMSKEQACADMADAIATLNPEAE